MELKQIILKIQTKESEERKPNLIILSLDFFNSYSSFLRSTLLRAVELWLGDNSLWSLVAAKGAEHVEESVQQQDDCMNFYWMIKGRDCSKIQQLLSSHNLPSPAWCCWAHRAAQALFTVWIGWKLCHIAHLPVTDYSPRYSVFPSYISSFKCKICPFAFPKPETMTQEELELWNHLLSISHSLLIDRKTR